MRSPDSALVCQEPRVGQGEDVEPSWEYWRRYGRRGADYFISDGVGNHLGYQVVMKAIELGMENLPRVPHLNFVLQGEDTVNFKVTINPSLMLLLMML